MFIFTDASIDTTVTVKNLALKDLSVALYVLYYFGPHDPVDVIPKNDDTYELVAGYYGSNAKWIKKEIKNCDGNLMRLYKS